MPLTVVETVPLTEVETVAGLGVNVGVAWRPLSTATVFEAAERPAARGCLSARPSLPPSGRPTDSPAPARATAARLPPRLPAAPSCERCAAVRCAESASPQPAPRGSCGPLHVELSSVPRLLCHLDGSFPRQAVAPLHSPPKPRRVAVRRLARNQRQWRGKSPPRQALPCLLPIVRSRAREARHRRPAAQLALLRNSQTHLPTSQGQADTRRSPSVCTRESPPQCERRSAVCYTLVTSSVVAIVAGHA